MDDQSLTKDLLNSSLPWQEELSQAITSQKELYSYLGLTDKYADIPTDFPIFAPKPYLDRIDGTDPDDPILRQIAPHESENTSAPGFSDDPVGDILAVSAPGGIQKYSSRSLLLSSHTCAVNCRFCFRRNIQYPIMTLGEKLETLGSLIRTDGVDEIILSGGDPLMQSDAELEALFQLIESSEAIERIRIHTRIPVVLPSRVTESLLSLLSESSKSVVMVIHCNHARELDDVTQEALKALKSAGVELLNQSVLLKGINDSCDTLVALSKKLMSQGVLPYYLHQLDRARGTHHFEVPVSEGLRIVEEMRAQTSGYLVPRYVREIAGESSKSLLG